MNSIVCLDLEGVLVPEIWIAFSQATGIKELSLTTRDISDYSKLMSYRMEILDRENLKLKDIQRTIATIRPLDGAFDFLTKLREKTQVVILSDTFREFASPLMKQLNWPTILCNELELDSQGRIKGIKMRQEDGKFHAVKAFKSLGFKTFASGDSYNDLHMIHEADAGALFRAPEKILQEEKDLPSASTYEGLTEIIDNFLSGAKK